MLKLQTFITEQKNVHMEHLEDLVLNKGVVGAREIFNFLTSLGDMLGGSTKNKVATTVKWDGAPAIFMGVDPEDGKFFIAKKGLFNVKPKLYKTNADIDADLSGSLNQKFKIALAEFSKLGLRSGVVQGDLMFTSGDISTETIDGQKYYTFQPNTIVYAVPVNTPLGKQIKRSKIGVVWHTTYSGNKIQNMRASFGKGIVRRMKKNAAVWMDDATYRDVSGQATMTADETKEYRAIVSSAGSLLRAIPSNALNTISQDEDLLVMVKTYNNTKVRAGEEIGNTTAHARGLITFLNDKFKAEEDKRKTEKGKAAVREKKKAVMGPLLDVSVSDLAKIFDFMNIIVQAKNMVVAKMNRAATIGTFLRTKTGIKVTSPEGYVAIDRLKGGAVKLVDRLEFSRANFSDDVLKGW
jgi:hypothetical protein